MAAATGSTSSSTSVPWPSLDPQQRELLLNALASNQRNKPGQDSSDPFNNQAANPKPSALSSQPQVDPTHVNPSTMNPSTSGSFFDDPSLTAFDPGSSAFDLNFPTNIEEPLLDFSTADVEGEGGEKRKMSEPDEDDEESFEGGEAKRRESEDKTSRKPGRKPLTSEPTTKRKAQNRAAQRAFRERKERHLNDLEDKVADLEKASEAANHENGVLRAQVQRLQDEVKQYRKRLSSDSSGSSPRGTASQGSLDSALPGFNFDFSQLGSDRSAKNNPFANSRSQSSGSVSQRNNNGSSNGMNSAGQQKTSIVDSIGGIFSNGFLDTIGSSDFGFPKAGSPENVSDTSKPTPASNGNYSSPSINGSMSSASPSASNQGPSSSGCTSPDVVDNLVQDFSKQQGQSTGSGAPSASNSTPGEFWSSDLSSSLPLTSKAGLTSASETTNSESGNFDWLAAQNGGQFDPVLFGNYRDTQDAIIGQGDFSGGLFEDSLGLPDFSDPFNFNLSADTTIPARIETPKPNLMEQVERQKEGEDAIQYPLEDQNTLSADLYTTHKIWNQLQSCPKFKSGDFDVDSLCAELATKAKCTQTGVAVPKDAVESALWKLTEDPKDYQRKAGQQ
ncbi:MAG: DNA-binding transcription factor yap1 [Alyxoria varia]|nr:MAG: DNA-binding transcription factor yap1 [Alyxoria varia]